MTEPKGRQRATASQEKQQASTLIYYELIGCVIWLIGYGAYQRQLGSYSSVYSLCFIPVVLAVFIDKATEIDAYVYYRSRNVTSRPSSTIAIQLPLLYLLTSALPPSDLSLVLLYTNALACIFLVLLPKVFTLGEALVSAALLCFSIQSGSIVFKLPTVIIAAILLHRIPWLTIGIAALAVIGAAQEIIDFAILVSGQVFDPANVLVISIWLACCSALPLLPHLSTLGFTQIDLRKTFHLLFSVIFISGVFFNYQLLANCSIIIFLIGLAMQYLVLTLQQLKIRWTAFEHFLSVFADEKDRASGIDVFYTPITLMLAMSAPVWSFTAEKPELALLGVLSIGIGDSLAAVIGTRFGWTKWYTGCKKSLQGTFCSILGQLAFVYLIFDTQVVSNLFIPIITSSMVETFTNHIDNLTVPLILFTFFV